MENKLKSIKVCRMSFPDSNKKWIKLISRVHFCILNLHCNLVFSSPVSSMDLS